MIIPQNDNRESYICNKNYSAKLFANTQNVQDHSTSRSEESFACPWAECGKTFEFSDVLQLHLRMHECSTSNKSSKSTAYVENTELDVHLLGDRLESFSCTWADCNRSFAFEQILQLHLRMHTDNDSLECSVNTEFIGTDNIKEHSKDPLVTYQEKSFICTWPDCGRSFVFEDVLNLHVRMHAERKSFRCSLCDMKFLKNDHLMKHQKNHSNVSEDKLENIASVEFKNDKNVHNCSGQITDDVRFTNEDLLHEESNSLEAPGEDAVLGDQSIVVCNKVKKPRGTSKTIVRTYKCNWENCSKTFTRLDGLNQHKRFVHGASKFTCYLVNCWKTFATRKSLEYHCLKYHDRKTLVAFNSINHSKRNNCLSENTDGGKKSNDRSFANCGNVTKPTVASKKTVKTFKCNWENCFKVFTSLWGFNQHTRFVHGASKFTCCIVNCWKAFRTREVLERHYLKYHGSEALVVLNSSNQPDTNDYLPEVIDQKVYHPPGTIGKSDGTYKCNWKNCSKTFTRVWGLHQHIRFVHGASKFTCSVVNCWQTFGAREALERHCLKYHGIEDLTAPNSSNHPKTNDYLSEEVDNSTRTSDRNVADCEKVDIPSETVKKREQIFKCGFQNCKQIFTHAWELLKHTTFEHGASEFVCDFPNCWMSFEGCASLERHRLQHYPKSSNQTFINERNQDVNPKLSRLSLKSGIYKSKPEQASYRLEIYKCDYCTKSYKWRRSLLQHLQRVHKKSGLYKCNWENCTESFSKIVLLEQHREECHRFTCMCSNCTNNKDGLNKIVQHKCDVAGCGKLFSSIFVLKGHAQHHKSGIYPIRREANSQKNNGPIINQCESNNGKQSEILENLQHIYECEYCGYIFKWRRSLIAHLKIFHNGKGIYKCENCTQTFSKITLLRQHREESHPAVR